MLGKMPGSPVVHHGMTMYTKIGNQIGKFTTVVNVPL